MCSCTLCSGTKFLFACSPPWLFLQIVKHCLVYIRLEYEIGLMCVLVSRPSLKEGTILASDQAETFGRRYQLDKLRHMAAMNGRLEGHVTSLLWPLKQ